MTKFIAGGTRAGGPHPTSGLPGFPARDYMAHGGSTVRAPFTGYVPSGRPIGRASTQNPAAGFGGARVYLYNPKTGHEAYLAHFGLGPNDLLLSPGERFKCGDAIGKVWAWPNDPGRSHIHMGYEGGDPLFKLVDADGDIKQAVPRKIPKPQYVLRKVGRPACRGGATEDGRWQVRQEREGKRPRVIFQGPYGEAAELLQEILAERNT